MGDGLFVHASHSLAVISIGCSIIVPFQGGKKGEKKGAQHSEASSEGRKFKGARTAALICHAAIFVQIWIQLEPDPNLLSLKAQMGDCPPLHLIDYLSACPRASDNVFSVAFSDGLNKWFPVWFPQANIEE